MIRILLLSVLVLTGSLVSNAPAQEVDIEGLDLMTKKYEMCMQVGTPGTPSWRFIYTNLQARLFAYKMEDGELIKDWETVDLGSKAVSVFLDDIYGDGADKLVVTFKRGPMVPHVDRWMKKLGFDFWIRLESFWKERCESDEFHCAERSEEGCRCAAMFYRKRIF